MDLVSLNYSTDSSSLTGTSLTTSTSTTSDTTSTGDVSVDTGDEKNFSKGAGMMQKLKDLQSSDPEKFKQVTQSISDKLSEAAKNSSDSKTSGMLSDMASKFSDASQSGSMSGLQPPTPPSGATGAQGQAAMKYAQSGGSNPMEQVDSIISDALSGTDAASA